MKENKDYLKLFKVGDIVYHYKYGRCGVVKSSGKDEPHPIRLQRIDPIYKEITIISATKEIIKALSFAPYDFDNLDKFTRVRPIKENTLVFVKEAKRYHWVLRRTVEDCLSRRVGEIAVYDQQYPNQCIGNISCFKYWTFDIPDLMKEKL